MRHLSLTVSGEEECKGGRRQTALAYGRQPAARAAPRIDRPDAQLVIWLKKKLCAVLVLGLAARVTYGLPVAIICAW